MGDSHDKVCEFSEDARKQAGDELLRVQYGAAPTDWKPFPTVGTGVNEIRVSVADGWYRVMYVAKFGEAVYVLHAFQKQTTATPQNDVDTAKRRYKRMIEFRTSKGLK